MKQRYIPSKLSQVASDDQLGIQIYATFYENCERGNVEAMAFVGKAIKPVWYGMFKDKDQFDREVNRLFASRAEEIARKNEYKQRRKLANASHDVEPGQVFCCSWGYDQTNVDFYQVISVSGQMATVQAIKQESVEDLDMQGQCVPLVGEFKGEPRKVKIQKFDVQSEPFFKVNSFSTATRMSPVAMVGGSPVYKSVRWSSYA